MIDFHIFSECSDDSDCGRENTMCYDFNCICIDGFYENKDTGNCESGRYYLITCKDQRRVSMPAQLHVNLPTISFSHSRGVCYGYPYLHYYLSLESNACPLSRHLRWRKMCYVSKRRGLQYF